jgi:ribonuclease HII
MSSTPPNRTASLSFEHEAHAQGFTHIIGFDEAGRGPWAGPLVVGAVLLPTTVPDLAERLKNVRDSKQVSAGLRAEMAMRIKATALAWGLGVVHADEISTRGLSFAQYKAMDLARDDLFAMHPTPQATTIFFLDHFRWPAMQGKYAMRSITHGDQLSLSIAAASILAKEYRDEIMRDLDTELPQYGFAQHKGYGTAAHLKALQTYGVSPVHRTNYAPVRAIQKRLL